MKNFLIIATLFLTACNMQGVSDPSLSDNDSIKENLGENDSSKPFLLVDSINGQANNMVYNRKDGLRIEWTKKDTSHPILLNDVVMVNYKARVAGGEEYDSNTGVGEPVPLKTNIGMMIKGWEEGLLLLHVGDKARLMIPNALAYGEDGYIDVVPPQADIIVEIEIVSRVEPIVLDEGVKVYVWKPIKFGETPVKNQVITFDYFAYSKGKGAKLYDNSYQNEEPFSFKYQNAGVIEGLHQGFSVLKAGENAFIEIPTHLAYGKKGLVDHVPSKADVVYDVRIKSIE